MLQGLSDLGDLKNKKVLLRADLNVPLKNGVITDEYRIISSLKSIKYLLKGGAIVTVCSHLGRPQGKPTPEFEIEPVRQRLLELLAAEKLEGKVEVMENLRFDPREESGDEAFVAELIKGQDLFVNDAFGTCHRAHASIVGPPKHLPAVAGVLLQKEMAELLGLTDNPSRPLVVIMGGSKVGDKLNLIYSLIDKADTLAIGGAMAFSFLVAKGATIKSPLVEEECIPKLAELLDSVGQKIVLPEDLVGVSPVGEIRQIGRNVPEGWQAKDIGPGTAAIFVDLIESAGTIFWNGPVGVFEEPEFMSGTKALAESIASASAYTIVGGGDSASAIHTLGLESSVDHLSTGGGAMLEFLEKGSLVGIDALLNNASNS